MTEKVTALCSQCDQELETTWEAIQKSHKCPMCNHGDLSIIYGEYTEIANVINQAAKYLAAINDQADRARLAQPITDLLKKRK